MIKLRAFLISIILVLITLFILDRTYVKKIEDYYKVNDNSMRYNTSYEKYKSKDMILENMTPNTVLLLGSSELTTTINEDFHPKKIFNYGDFNIMQVGVGNSQNIIHAITLGSIGDDVRNNEIVMIQSIQWFDNKNGILKDAFLSRISDEHVYNTMANEKISKETKEKFINRVIELSSTNKELNDKYKSYKRYFIEGKGNIITEPRYNLDNYIYSLKSKKKFYDSKGKGDYPLTGDKTPNYNWETMTNEFVEKVKRKTDNNNYAVDNNYYDTYLSKKYDSFKNSNKNLNYLDSPEYSDYKIFLDIAKELGIEVEVIIFPVNGKWNDYTGVSRKMREEAYKKIEDVAKKYTNVKVINYGNREYDDYFLFDVMHVGVKGWLEVEKELYEFAKKD